MNHHDTTPSTTTSSSTSRVRRGATHVAAAFVGLAAVAALLTATTPTATAATSDTCVPSKATTDFRTPVAKAGAVLTKTLNNLQNQRYDKAAAHLRILGHQVRLANTAATGLIGLPPTDPESDVPPGIPAVQKVAGLDHTITVKLVPTFQNLSNDLVVQRLGTKLNVADACRDVMLEKVIGLKAAARDDYADGLADTLPGYQKELTAISTALGGSGLTTAARSSLESAQQVVTSTQTDMNRVFGGGERTARHPH